MGICNSSTKEDVRKDRERTGARAQQGGQQQGQQQQGQQGHGSQIPGGQGMGGHGMGMGIPPGSYRDANGVPRSVAREAQHMPTSSYRDGGGVGGQQGGGGEYGTSYTNRKTKEYDLLSDIVKQTRHNFIDVSLKSGQLDEEDLVERGQKYVRNLSELPSYISLSSSVGGAGTAYMQQGALAGQAAVSPTSFGTYYQCMALPAPSSLVVKRPAATEKTSALSAGLAQQHHHAQSPAEVDYAALVQVMRTAHIPMQDIEFIVSTSSHLSLLMTEGSLVSEPPPKIVLTFEELLNDK